MNATSEMESRALRNRFQPEQLANNFNQEQTHVYPTHQSGFSPEYQLISDGGEQTTELINHTDFEQTDEQQYLSQYEMVAE